MGTKINHVLAQTVTKYVFTKNQKQIINIMTCLDEKKPLHIFFEIHSGNDLRYFRNLHHS